MVFNVFLLIDLIDFDDFSVLGDTVQLLYSYCTCIQYLVNEVIMNASYVEWGIWIKTSIYCRLCIIKKVRIISWGEGGRGGV